MWLLLLALGLCVSCELLTACHWSDLLLGVGRSSLSLLLWPHDCAYKCPTQGPGPYTHLLATVVTLDVARPLRPSRWEQAQPSLTLGLVSNASVRWWQQ